MAIGVLGGPPVRVLSPGQMPVVADALDADPYASVIVAARFDEHQATGARLGGQFWGMSGGRAGLCFNGPNLVPLSGDDRAMRSFASMAARRPRYAASICGRRELVLPLWHHLHKRWGPARAVRADQPFLICDAPPAIRPDPGVRAVSTDLLPSYFPAAVAMFTEEIGVDPTVGDDGRSYRARVQSLMSQGRAFARYDDGELVFKAEVGSLSDRAALLQGVWIPPHRRGQGIAAPAMAAVVEAVRTDLGRVPCLYVNDFNLSARAAYRKVGFTQIAAYASVLF